MITFTLPHELNKVVRSNQKDCYSLLFKASSASIKKLAADPRHLGAQPGMLGILHTWGRDLSYHPHVHYLVPGGGINNSGKWIRTPHETGRISTRPTGYIINSNHFKVEMLNYREK